ncbi:hypothetical protein P280DRAFT_553016 [Massarina eburnea CBS 473.64]|uniref:Uncharacterized protein n=1 Tax=Massarina eburnea CBS 473.64 TaxID=1395130 RepID=A0A6A6RMD3_9PLEO|nr:hypothetical protein P280DRAFT_553016 [Massarina eburnea CBS 473.64]
MAGIRSVDRAKSRARLALEQHNTPTPTVFQRLHLLQLATGQGFENDGGSLSAKRLREIANEVDHLTRRNATLKTASENSMQSFKYLRQEKDALAREYQAKVAQLEMRMEAKDWQSARDHNKIETLEENKAFAEKIEKLKEDAKALKVMEDLLNS